MALQEQKSEVFANVAALKVLVSDVKGKYANAKGLWPTLQTVSKNPIDFLLDLVKELVGYEAIRDGVSNTLATSLDEIEDNIKYAIKLKLKELISCGVNPQIPLDLQYTGLGYNFNIKDIDFTHIFKLNPESQFGRLFYSDITPQIDSTDANTFLYYTIQDNGNENLWGSQVGYNNIVAVEFNGQLGLNTNILTVKASDYYSTNKKLIDWNNDYVDSIKLFPDAQFFAKMMDTIFNSFGQVIQKTPSESEAEEILNAIVDNLLETEPDDIIDDSFFTFSNAQMVEITEKARFKSLGISKLDTCYSFAKQINPNTILQAVSTFEQAATFEERKTAIDKSINKFGDVYSSLGSSTDKYTMKLNFFVELIRALVKSIVGMIFSPKMILIFLVNFKIVQGGNATFNGIAELAQFLKSLIKQIIDVIKAQIVQILLEIALSEVKKLQSQVQDKIQQELVKNKLKGLLSLVGVPQDIIRTVSKF